MTGFEAAAPFYLRSFEVAAQTHCDFYALLRYIRCEPDHRGQEIQEN